MHTRPRPLAENCVSAFRSPLGWGCLALLAFAAVEPVYGAIDRATGSMREIIAIESEHDPELRQFYAHGNYALVWTSEMRAAAGQALAAADEHGLDSQEYRLGEWRTFSPSDEITAARQDASLTAAFLRYMRDVRLGRTAPEAIYKDAEWPRDDYDAATALHRALAESNLAGLVASLPPVNPDYRRLQNALARYRAIVVAGGWPRVPDGPTFSAVESDTRRSVLVRRLALEDPEFSGSGDTDALDEAVRRFQRRHGLDPDGRVGAKTLAALNVPAVERVAQIRANLERWRWMPRNVPERRIVVNTAAFELEAFNGDQVAVRSKVIVGDRRHPTPLLQAMAVAVTVNPPWNVPASIARNEILPHVRKDPNYLRSQSMVLLNGSPGDPYGETVNWRAVSPARLPYRFQQLPGPSNALGALKLELPNQFNVYLHDTPAKGLFARSDRALSHGCVRVEQILPLAAFAVGGDAEQSRSMLAGEVASGTTHTLSLGTPLRIYIGYWTVFVGEDGELAFREDIYGRDGALLAAMDRRRAGTAAMAAAGCGPHASHG
jgi:murein L,D-transpeptidase YcbB/YkuD